MRGNLGLAICILAALAVPWDSCHAEFDIWHSPLCFGTSDPALTLTLAGAQMQFVQVNRSLTCENAHIALGLVLPSDVAIDGVTVCYAIDSPQCFISGIRLVSMNEPSYMTTLHYDPAHLSQVGEHCYRTDLTSAVPVTGTITLTLELDFWHTAYAINIGAIAIHVSHPVSALEDDGEAEQSKGILLKPNRPNPFSTPTAIEYSVEQAGEIDLQICDVTGRLVRTLVRGELPAGDHRFVWDGRDDGGRELPSGTYYYLVRAGQQVGSRGMMLIR